MDGGNESDDNDSALAAVAAGELEALERLYRDLRVAVFSVALAVVGDRPSAEDVLHDTFVRVCERAHQYRPGTNPTAWVLTIARNLALDVVRKRARPRRAEHQTPPAVQSGPGTTGAWTDALMTLEQVEREIVVLHVLGGLTHRETAAEVGLPPGTVRWKYRVALNRLASVLSESGDG